jgi:uncharacterized protein (DUF736 family)
MAYEQRDNSGSLFKNDRKEKENQPDYTGTGMCGGEEIRISAWLKTAKSGKKFLSMSFQPKVEDHQNEKPKRQVGGMSDAAMDDEIPF